MIYLLILFIAVVISIIVTINDGWTNGVFEKLGLGILQMIFALTVAAIISLITALTAGRIGDKESILVDEYEIVALQDNTSISGSFFLGSGNVDGKMMYVFMSKEDEGYRMQSLKTSNSLIIYSNSPKIEVYGQKFKNKKTRLLFGSMPLGEGQYYKIYVPEGTIKQDYNIDLK